MAEKRNLKKLIDILIPFEQWETKSANNLFERYKSGRLRIDKAVIETAISIAKNERLKKQDVLSTIYMEYQNFLKEVPEDERKTIEGTISRYERYTKALKNIRDNPVILKQAQNIENEAINIIIEGNHSGEKRFGDMYNAKMLLEDNEGHILFCAPWKRWLIWDGRRWKKDEENGIYQLAMNSIKEMYLKAKAASSTEEKLMLIEHAGRSETARKIEAMVRTAAWSGEVMINPELLDRADMIFNCRNGSIDLLSGRLIEHDPVHRITKISPVDYDAKAECPIWEDFLASIFKKNREIIGFVQKVLGMSLSGDSSAQAMFILYGTGANGKSVFINTVMHIMGDYGANTPTETFMQKKGDGANNDIARLKGTRFVSAMEADYGGRLAEAVVKRLTGDDKISARFLYGEYFEFTPTFKIFMATNHKPKIAGMDNAIWRRIKLIPFEVTFTEKQQDSKLKYKLEAELTGILAWMVEGCILWQKEGLGQPPAVDEATKEYRYEMSAIETFLHENCRKDANEMSQSSKLYSAYKIWAEQNNEHIMSTRSFSMRLSESGLDKVRLSSGYFWIGIAIDS